MHRLLKRQLQQIYGKEFDVDQLPDEVKRLIAIVSETYEENAKERSFLEHVNEINSNELNEANARLTNQKAGLEEEVSTRTADLQASQVRYHDLLNNMSNGVAVYKKVDENSGFECVDYNPLGGWLLGLDVAQEAAVFSTLSSSSIEVLDGLLDEVWRSGGRKHGSLVQYDGSELEIWVEVDVYVLPTNEVVAIFDDITQKKRSERESKTLQRQLQQAQKMETLGLLTGGIAHDFNNILASVVGYTELAMSEEIDNEDVMDSLRQVRIAGERGRDLINQMLAFSRGESGEFSEISLREVVEDTIKIVRPSVPSSIVCDHVLDSGLPHIRGDKSMLMQVIMNICVNARDAIGEKGTISIVLSDASVVEGVCVSCLKSFASEYIVLEISDSGTGMDPASLNNIFEPFFSTKPSGEGTGMGLAMVHGIMHQHGGHILVESTPGQGTQFKLLFPVLNASKVNEIPTAGHKKTFHAPSYIKTAMVVDDEFPVAQLMGKILNKAGIDTVVFCDSQRALKAFDDAPERFDLVITDQTMPEVTGINLVRHIQTKRKELPVIICTGFSHTLSPKLLEEVGVYGLLEKPVDREKLYEMIASLPKH